MQLARKSLQMTLLTSLVALFCGVTVRASAERTLTDVGKTLSDERAAPPLRSAHTQARVALGPAGRQKLESFRQIFPGERRQHTMTH